MNTVFIHDYLQQMIREDLGNTEVDNDNERASVFGVIEAQQEGVMCGSRFIVPLFELLTPLHRRGRPRRFEALADKGTFKPGAQLIGIEAHPETLRHGIRMALNLLGHVCGVATRTREVVGLVHGTSCRLLDTRKTTPLNRTIEKYAVRCGGGYNHRHGRYDGVMLKREDIILDGGVTAALDRIEGSVPHLTGILVECDTVAELEEVLSDGRAKYALLDNMTPQEVWQCVQLAKGRVTLEASGVTLDAIPAYAATGVPFISTSELVARTKCKMHLVVPKK